MKKLFLILLTGLLLWGCAGKKGINNDIALWEEYEAKMREIAIRFLKIENSTSNTGQVIDIGEGLVCAIGGSPYTINEYCITIFLGNNENQDVRNIGLDKLTLLITEAQQLFNLLYDEPSIIHGEDETFYLYWDNCQDWFHSIVIHSKYESGIGVFFNRDSLLSIY